MLPLLFAASLLAPTTSWFDTYPKNHDIDMLHYAFDLTLSDDTDVIVGVATIDARYLRGGQSQLRLDLVGMDVSAIRMNDRELAFEHREGQLFIDLGYEPAAMERIRVEVSYSGIPTTGLTIGPNKHGDRSFFSNNWPNRARHWLPTVDHPYDKATSEMRITAPANYQVVSNGMLVEESDWADGLRITHWRQSVPIATWLYVLGVAEFAVQYVDQFKGKSIQTWVFDDDRDAGFYDFAVPTKDVLEFYSEHVGPYSYEKLANVQSNSVGGGMEAASAIFYNDASVTGERNRGWQIVIIHEIAHQWFGNAVTEADWNDVWLSEGFATYFTLLYRESRWGRDDFVDGLKDARRRVVNFYEDRFDYSVIHENLDDMSQVTSQMTYQKGAWVLHMLRARIGTDTFWDGIRTYYEYYRDRNATTADFRRVMEEASGQELGEFFDQWLYQGGIPRLQVDWHASDDGVTIEVEQLQETYRFAAPVDFLIRFDDGTEAKVAVDLTADPADGPATAFYETESSPVEVVVDPETRLLAEWEVGRMQ